MRKLLGLLVFAVPLMSATMSAAAEEVIYYEHDILISDSISIQQMTNPDYVKQRARRLIGTLDVKDHEIHFVSQGWNAQWKGDEVHATLPYRDGHRFCRSSLLVYDGPQLNYIVDYGSAEKYLGFLTWTQSKVNKIRFRISAITLKMDAQRNQELVDAGICREAHSIIRKCEGDSDCKVNREIVY